MEEIAPIQIGRKTVTFEVTSGRVAVVTLRSETHVSGSQGKFSSSTSRWTEFSIIDGNGVEHPQSFPTHDFFIRGGNRISIVWVFAGSNGYWTLICNHDTQKSAFVRDYSKYLYLLGLKRKLGCNVLIFGFAAGVVGTWINETGGKVIGTLAFLFGIPTLIVDWYHGSQIWKTQLRPKLNEIAAQLQENTESIRWP